MLSGEDLSSCSSKTESDSLRKCPYDHWLTGKAYLSATAVTNISTLVFAYIDGGKNQVVVTNIYQFLPTRWRQKSAGIDMGQNRATVALCIRQNGR